MSKRQKITMAAWTSVARAAMGARGEIAVSGKTMSTLW